MAAATGQLELRILGPLQAVRAGELLALGGPKQRAVLALLGLRAGSSLSTDQLVASLWPHEPPATAVTTVQVYVSRLRKLLGEGAIVSDGGGYRLCLGEDGLDAERFQRLASRARELRASGQLPEAAAAVSSALELWRGGALTDFAYESWAQAAVGRLEEDRLACLEEQLDIELALGQH